MNRKKSILIFFLIVIVLGVGFVSFNHAKAKQDVAAMRFNKSHFNKNVIIYGISVGKLTTRGALKKINSSALNRATIKDNRIVNTRVNRQTISQKEVDSYFSKQKTKYPSDEKYNFKNLELETAQNKLKLIKNRSVDYEISGKRYTFSREEYFPIVSYYDNEYYFENTEKISKKIDEINKSVTTFNKEYPFELPDKNTIKVKNESYGWAINEKHLIPAIEKAIVTDKTKINGKDYIYGLGYSTYGTGYGLANHGLCKTYIIVSIKQQKVWLYKDGKNVLVLNDVVTGDASKQGNAQNSDETPVGVWYIEYKQSPSTLKGLNDDGSSYSSPVKYWMPFTQTGCGFHDASWRSDWSKTAYLKGGSHGCVNIKPSEIKKVWDNVEQYEAVIIYK